MRAIAGSRVVRVIDRGARLRAGRGCTARGRHRVECRPGGNEQRFVGRLRGGDDTLVSRAGRHLTIFADGGAGRDRLAGGPGSNVLRGGSGRDRLIGGPAGDGLRGDGANDVVIGGRGNDRLFGVGGDDRLDEGRGRNAVFGGPGRDRIDAEYFGSSSGDRGPTRTGRIRSQSSPRRARHAAAVRG